MDDGGIFWGHLVFIRVIWYFFPIWYFCTKENLATLASSEIGFNFRSSKLSTLYSWLYLERKYSTFKVYVLQSIHVRYQEAK
jgi:hypothetical protein